LPGDAKLELVNAVSNNLLRLKEEIGDANKEVIKSFPMDLAFPFVFMFYGVQFAQKVELSGKYGSFEFNLEHMSLLRKSQAKLLKQIPSEWFKETNFRGEEIAAQAYLDDNAFNSIFSVISTVEKMYSARDLAKGYPQAAAAMKFMTTDTAGKVLPQFIEDYGAGKKLDVVFSPSHDLFTDGVKDAKPTGIYMDKNGNFKMVMNIPAQINIENMPGMWEPIRNLYFTFVAKAKVQLNNTEPENAHFVLTPRSVEMSNLVIKKGEEEIPMEQMMIKSLVNIQLE
jgi:hypothetical protein